MLIEFDVKNFRSFKQEQNFSMEVGKRLRKFKSSNTIEKKKIKLLKSALIFGGNANGKTNLIFGLRYLKHLIIRPTNDILQKFIFDSFAKNTENTLFKIKFLKKEKIYNYNLEYNPNEVVSESLYVDGKLIFDREYQDIIESPTLIKPLIGNVRKNQLLLYFAQQYNEEYSKDAYEWFSNDLVFVNTQMMPNYKFKLLKEESFKKKFLYFLKAADFNITDIDVKEKLQGNGEDEDSENYFERSVYEVFSKHKSRNEDFDISFVNESVGTKAFIFIAIYILSNSDKTLVIDEFDSHFHLELAKALITVINSENQTNQFILTSHELSLMDCNLRQDQVWFAEKNQFGESELFSLFDFDDNELKRSDASYKKRYLEGRYGATQIVNENLLLEALNIDV